MRTLLLDCDYGLDGICNYAFQGTVSIFDFDLVIWDPDGSLKRYQGEYHRRYNGQPSLNGAETVELLEATSRRKKEFDEFLKLGRSLIVVASPKRIIWVQTGNQEKSGTGRNQKVTSIVTEFDILSALPFEYSAIVGQGLELEPVSAEVSSLFRDVPEGWLYRCTLEEFPGQPAVRVAGVNKAVGAFHRTEAGGYIALLPEPWVPEASEDDNGQSETERLANAQALVSWAEAKANEHHEPLPAWCADLRFDTELTRATSLEKAETSLARAQAKIEKLKAEQAADEQWKRLIASDGVGFENQVRAAFVELGFEVLETERNRGDFRLEYRGTRVVVEAKGLIKSAAEKHAAQLEKWVAAELSEEASAKGILIVNGWRSVPPSERQAVFPDQMLAYAAARSHCLITGLQLLTLTRTVQSHELSRDQAAQMLIETVEPLIGYDDPEALFTSQPAETEATG